MELLIAPKAFREAAASAFPMSFRVYAEEAAGRLAGMVNDSYCSRSVRLTVSGENVYIPNRIHFFDSIADIGNFENASAFAQCLFTRSTDGHLRQKALQSVIKLKEPWAVPFVVILTGEYVVEIALEILSALNQLDRGLYRNFLLENRALMQQLEAKATSYWNVYYRNRYPHKWAYPGLMVIREFQIWAA